jgi:hypothetical protein
MRSKVCSAWSNLGDGVVQSFFGLVPIALKNQHLTLHRADVEGDVAGAATFRQARGLLEKRTSVREFALKYCELTLEVTVLGRMPLQARGFRR